MSICMSQSKEVLDLIRALGLPKNCTEFSVHFKVDEAVLIRVTSYAIREQVAELCKFANNYVLADVTEEFNLKEKNDH